MVSLEMKASTVKKSVAYSLVEFCLGLRSLRLDGTARLSRAVMEPSELR